MEGQDFFIHSKKFTGVGASGLDFDFKVPADAGRLTGVLVTYAAPNATVAATVHAVNNNFAHGRLLVNNETNLNVPFMVSTYAMPPRMRQEFIPCDIVINRNSNISGFIRMFDGTPENEDCTFTIHALYQRIKTAK
jgi:hypothetical protein